MKKKLRSTVKEWCCTVTLSSVQLNSVTLSDLNRALISTVSALWSKKALQLLFWVGYML